MGHDRKIRTSVIAKKKNCQVEGGEFLGLGGYV